MSSSRGAPNTKVDPHCSQAFREIRGYTIAVVYNIEYTRKKITVSETMTCFRIELLEIILFSLKNTLKPKCQAMTKRRKKKKRRESGI